MSDTTDLRAKAVAALRRMAEEALYRFGSDALMRVPVQDALALLDALTDAATRIATLERDYAESQSAVGTWLEESRRYKTERDAATERIAALERERDEAVTRRQRGDVYHAAQANAATERERALREALEDVRVVLNDLPDHDNDSTVAVGERRHFVYLALSAIERVLGQSLVACPPSAGTEPTP
jgi:hypothetical protein